MAILKHNLDHSRIAAAIDCLRTHAKHAPRVGIVLGSGLSFGQEELPGTSIAYSQIPGFPEATVGGHSGVLTINDAAIVFSGRFHWYEGHDLFSVVLPVYLMQALGVQRVVLTNAAGGINPNYLPGDLVLISDHINLMGINPLRGRNDEQFGPRFPDMTAVYSKSLRDLCNCYDPDLKQGVYAAMSGPCYETPAEIAMLRTLGADLVGMSTVPEAIVARYLGIEVAGISCVTNMAAGISGTSLDHAEVIAVGKRSHARFKALLQQLIANP